LGRYAATTSTQHHESSVLEYPYEPSIRSHRFVITDASVGITQQTDIGVAAVICVRTFRESAADVPESAGVLSNVNEFAGTDERVLVLFIRPATAYIGVGLVLSAAGVVVPEKEHIASEVRE
jgi:hypothetical protein